MYNRKELSVAEIKAEILKSLKEMDVAAKKIILFGSRARGEFSKHSDYDILIITEKTFTIKEKMKITKRINHVLANLLIPCDIIVKSEKEVEYLKHQIGMVVREAIKEGVEL